MSERFVEATANSTLAVAQLGAGLFLLQFNPLLALLVLVSSIDNFFDVYRAVYQAKPPGWYVLVNVPAEMISVFVSLLIVVYIQFFTTYFDLPMAIALTALAMIDLAVSMQDLWAGLSTRAPQSSEWVE